MSIYSYSQVARELGIDRRVIPYLVTICKLAPKPVSTNGRAKGLSESDLRKIRKILGIAESVQ